MPSFICTLSRCLVPIISVWFWFPWLASKVSIRSSVSSNLQSSGAIKLGHLWTLFTSVYWGYPFQPGVCMKGTEEKFKVHKAVKQDNLAWQFLTSCFQVLLPCYLHPQETTGVMQALSSEKASHLPLLLIYLLFWQIGTFAD